MSTWRPDIDVLLSESEDEESEMKRNFTGREAVLFVVDANLYENFERFKQALEIIRGAFISGMLINDKDLLGVMFANTAESPEPYEPNCLDNIAVPDNCAVFLPLRQLTKSIVEHFLHFLTRAEMDFIKHYGIAENGGCGNFAATIRVCLNLFEHCGYSLNNATIVFMTDRETPHEVQSHEYQMALQKAGDLEGREIEFQLTPMVDDFDYELFYKEFLTLARGVELDSFMPPNAKQLREILADRKLRQDFLKRTLGHFHFTLGSNLKLAVQYYSYFRRRSAPRKVKLLRKDNTIIKQKQVIVVRSQDEETLEFTDEHELKTTDGWYEINLGSMPIRITTERINRVRNLHQPGMMLLGFKSKSDLPENLYYKPCNFMYPDDQKISGSKRLFRALWQRCLARDKIAVCLFMRKRKSVPRYVALVPVAAVDNEGKNFRSLLLGDGFKIIYLPMAKHIRQPNFDDWNSIENTAPEAGVELFQKMIKKLRIKYDPQLINDPSLELLQANLLALSLNIKTENGGLTEMPDAQMQDERIAQLLPNVDEIFGADMETVAKKRPAKAAAGNTAKVAKITDDSIQRYEFVEQLISNKALTTCTVPQLRTILEAHYDIKMPKTAPKQSIMDRIYEMSK